MSETSAIISRPVASVADAADIMVPASARATLEIDLNALRANWAKLNEVAGDAECAGVVKADAYGLGLEEIAGALAREGCRTFFTATIHEAQRVRAVAPGAAREGVDARAHLPSDRNEVEGQPLAREQGPEQRQIEASIPD